MVGLQLELDKVHLLERRLFENAPNPPFTDTLLERCPLCGAPTLKRPKSVSRHHYECTNPDCPLIEVRYLYQPQWPRQRLQDVKIVMAAVL